jgi:hypothetical protein
MIFLIIPYVILLVFGFKSTWEIAVNFALAGSSGILLPLLLFLVMILVIGPIMGIVNLIKMAFGKKTVKPPEQNNQPQQ